MALVTVNDLFSGNWLEKARPTTTSPKRPAKMTKSPQMQAADSFALFAKAKKAAEAAMLAAFEKDERRDTGACGFAWVELRPATHPFVRWMKANGQGDKHWRSGWWYSIHTSLPTQGLHVKEAGARAFAEAVNEAYPGADLDCYANSRVD